jgi:HD superfamily phosphodiesterase
MNIRTVIKLPDSKMVSDAQELARKSSEPYLFNHVMRAWIFSALLAKAEIAPPDPELLAVSSLLHDLGLTDKY